MNAQPEHECEALAAIADDDELTEDQLEPVAGGLDRCIWPEPAEPIVSIEPQLVP